MSIEANKQLARRFFESGLNARNMDVLAEIVSPDFVDRSGSSEPARGIESFRAFLKMVTGAFPDLHINVEDMIAEGSKVAVRLTIYATHTGVLMGEIQPTGKRARWTGIDVLQIEGNQITARWSERDLLGLMRQLGVA